MGSTAITGYIISLGPWPLRLLQKYNPALGPNHACCAHAASGTRGTLQDLPQMSGPISCKVLLSYPTFSALVS